MPKIHMLGLITGTGKFSLSLKAMCIASQSPKNKPLQFATCLKYIGSASSLRAGEATLDLSGKEIVALFEMLLSRVRA